ncbi:hypothetical protein NADFUDRAFT_41424 [Nadsonia fulvescens var. elongata DSM 6958]|uniref:TATA-binding protein-associated factor mot1 n=1 Tax=Nadsonia fulvescens var. elongata DSM 6958 TaxID=857566 RepID=A0A1E3PMY1_9ASCO|nr:hypothetical protein NADFUDRAFT_41424 [Nadsonia fulvescens var. elongata DSM 6958]
MSRLDRLVVLLDTGTSAFVRNTAADQLATLQSAHPEELLNLLGRVFPYLESRKWDTRVAAARAIGGIVANATKWDPNRITEENEENFDAKVKMELDDSEPRIPGVKIKELDDDMKIKPEPSDEFYEDNDTLNNLEIETNIKQELHDKTLALEDSLDSDELLTFAQFDIKSVIKNGGKLLGSAGKEYDDPYAHLNPADKLKRQKHILKNRLGMGGEFMEDELLNDGDLSDIAGTTSSIVRGVSHSSRPDSASASPAGMSPASSTLSAASLASTIPVKVDPGSPLAAKEDPSSSQSSARLRAMARRRAKVGAKSNSNKVRAVDLSHSAAARRAESEDLNNLPSPKPTNNNNCNSSSSTGIKSEASGDQPQFTATESHNNKLVVEHKPPPVSQLVAMKGQNSKVWPFEGICELLMVDLFDVSWEIRHGAALGLREVIKVHGGGAGRLIGKSRQVNDKRNHDWLEDLSCRLCCIFALDRFGDYVSDQVVAPVRESTAQTLGALLLHLPDDLITSTFGVLHTLVLQKDLDLDFSLWEACHGGMLGLRYMVSVRTDILFKNENLLDSLIEAVLHGLKEQDDDVQAMSAATLIPIVSEFVSLRPAVVDELLVIIWNCLSDLKDDLSASIGNLMDLLSKLCAVPSVLQTMKAKAEQDPLNSFSNLVPRLYPFLRHSITNVRKAVLRALQTFLSIEGESSKDWVNGKILRLIFQNLLVEQNEQVIKLSYEVWNSLLEELYRRGGSNLVTSIFYEHVKPLFTLMMTPIGVARHSFKLPSALFIRPSGASYGNINDKDENHNNTEEMGPKSTTPTGTPVSSTPITATRRKRKSTVAIQEESTIPYNIQVNIDSPMFLGDVTLVGYNVFMRTKIHAAMAMGRIMSLWNQDQIAFFGSFIDQYLGSNFSTQQLLSGLVLEEYAKSLRMVNETGPPTEFKEHFLEKLLETITCTKETMYRDLTPYLRAVRTQCQSLFSVFVENAKLSRTKLPQIAIVVQGDPDAGPDAFSIEHAERIATENYEKLKRGLSATYRISAGQALSDTHRSLLHSIDEAKDYKLSRDISIHAACAAAYISLAASLPKKLNPIIRSLMESIKGEENSQLQNRTAKSISELIDLFNHNGKQGPCDKLIKNLCAILCVDTSEVPEFHLNQKVEDSILSLCKEEARTDPADIIAHQKEVKAAKIKRLGSLTSLQELAKLYGSHLFAKIPKLKECMFSALRDLEKSDFDSLKNNGIYNVESVIGQEIIDSLSVIRALLPHLTSDLYAEFIPFFPSMHRILGCKFSVLRYTVAKCFATVCKVMKSRGISSLVESVLPMVPNALDLHSRQGSVECIYHLTSSMGSDILPYVVFLIVPVLGRMSDADKDVRLLATTTFASIIKLVPLESGIPDPEDMPQNLLEGRDREREFISQMLDPTKVKPFKLPVAIKADLRKYQQEGVNWLAFLNKYHLHGILCDDMGLGKTLQTICIISSDHYLRAEEYKKSGNSEYRRLPTLIICPPTLMGHWQHEIQQYAPFMKVIVYAGPPNVRSQFVGTFNDYDIVVTSYDIARNDVAIITKDNYNYCVLDEGHIIKNAATKLTQSVKKINANHRLILSGTPIQNNVLELWSLFDFLMPGFLGTEKVFNDRFAKPIAASKNSKSSSKEQEAGALALEALHKQVLPFLLRRLKEDVLSDLPPKIIQDYYCELSDLQKQLYGDFTKKQKLTVASELSGSSMTDADSKKNTGKQHIFQALQYMRKLCNHPSLVLNNKHPQYEKVMLQLQQSKQNISDIRFAPKLLALQNLLLDCGIGSEAGTASGLSSNGSTSNSTAMIAPSVISQHRALIFCQLKDMLDIIENDLLKKHMPSVTFMRLDGSTDPRDRHSIVQKFNNDPSIDILLLTTHVGGLGLNLTGADTVIFIEHDWNPMNDLQAMDRAHRIGQKKVVNVYRLITKNTLEEKIMGLQKFKLNIANTIINQQNSGLSSMDTDQILDLFNVEDNGVNASAAAGNGIKNGSLGTMSTDDAEGMLDSTGQLINSDVSGNGGSSGGKSNPIGELSELWDEKQYEEEYNLDNFISTLR